MALRAFRTLMALRPLVSFPFLALSCSFLPFTHAPATPWHPLLGEAAERNFDHPSQPPLS